MNFPLTYFPLALAITVLLIFSSTYVFCQSIVGGFVRDAQTREPLVGATVNVKGTDVGGVTGTDGRFAFDYNGPFPAVLLVRYVGYDETETTFAAPSTNLVIEPAKAGSVTLSNVTITDTRLTDKQRESPLTVEAMDYIAIRQTPAFNFYEGLGQLKGVDVTSASMGFKIINTRGFNSTSPVRSLQLIDGVDNQSPGLNFSLGNFLGASELDVVKVDLVMGASSAYYGPNAFNGVISMTTKDPFLTPGLSVMLKGGERSLLETGVRCAHFWSNKYGAPKFALKLNGYYFRAYDWEATNADPTSQSEDDATNPGGYDAVNRYGDEFNAVMDHSNVSGIWNRPGLGRFYRTGYWENDLVDYNTRNGKASASFHYKLTDSIEAIAASNFGTGTTVYQGDNRYSLKGILFFQNRVELRHPNKWFLRAYATNENAGDSYDAYFTALRLQEASKKDIPWATDYVNYWIGSIKPQVLQLEGYPTFVFPITQSYTDSILTVLAAHQPDLNQWHNETAAYANTGSLQPGFEVPFYQPGTPRFDSAFHHIVSTLSTEGGTRFFDKSALYHAQGEYAFRPAFALITVGGNARLYRPDSKGTIFVDTADRKIENYEYGVYAGVEKRIVANKLRLSATTRMDKNENFPFVFSPAASVVFVQGNHTLRASFSSAIRNPTLADQYLYYNVGRATLLGNLEGFDSLVTVESLVRFINTKNVDTIDYFNVSPVVPEKVRTIEVGYRAALFNRLYLDVNGYYSFYRDFIGYNIGVDMDYSTITNSVTRAVVYRVAANATGVVTTYGTSIGLQYFFKRRYTLSGNYSLNTLRKADEQDPIVPAYNTPKHKFNVGIAARDLSGTPFGLRVNEFGFNVNYKWVEGFTFEGSPQFTGFVPTYDMMDVQVNKRYDQINTTLKIGCSNLLGFMPLLRDDYKHVGASLFNNKHLEVYGGPHVGRLAYISLLFELNGNRLGGK
ncbi:MAG TPA: carboxypeptidase-like regulatory domain-containing protein [Chitinophagales bacterium]|nr:carboxypeptidase-like regulatory domain-containing protein [Chitinophagales bacterium]